MLGGIKRRTHGWDIGRGGVIKGGRTGSSDREQETEESEDSSVCGSPLRPGPLATSGPERSEEAETYLRCCTLDTWRLNVSRHLPRATSESSLFHCRIVRGKKELN